jgi:ribosomal protein S18 acetylase RimI-like enzyme
MVKIREINESELCLFEETFLYEAIFQIEGNEPYPKDIIYKPEIYVYIDNFGKLNNDFCLIAEVDNKIIGAVWIRILCGENKGYGNIDAETPEFAISVLKNFRRQGIGTLLMQKMIEYLKLKQYLQVSLSVEKKNYAVEMYKKLVF